jgi:hypothetical protein
VIVRQNLAAGRQTETQSTSKGRVRSRSTMHPKAAVETWAQAAQLRFGGSNSIAGVLDLATDRARTG